MKHEQTKQTGIEYKTRKAVIDRDGGACIICGNPFGIQLAHYIGRGQGGLGIKENLVCLCNECHRQYDNGDHREDYGEMIRRYLESNYPKFPDDKRKYNKYEWLNEGSNKDEDK